MERLCSQLRALEIGDVLDLWVDTRIDTGDGWRPEIEKALDQCAVAVLLVSADFLTSNFIRSVEVPTLLKRRASEGIRVYPVICRPCVWKKIGWLSGMQLKLAEGKALTGMSKYRQEAECAAIAEEIAAILEPSPMAAPDLNSDRISIPNLPNTGRDLFGRSNELDILNAAWANPQANMLSVVAMGGEGKSALVSHWLRQVLAPKDYDGARVFGWSFYSQGTREDKQASSDVFIDSTLRWFGSEPVEGESPWEKGRRLAGLIRRERTLLVLDGLEPLQYMPGERGGALRDPAIHSLVCDLATQNPGLCVITTRYEVEDLGGFADPRSMIIRLKTLSPQAGAQLLRKLGVKGEDAELEQASADVAGHALAVKLLGSYLRTVYDGDILQRDKIVSLFDEKEDGGHAQRVMASYEKWFIDECRPELSILRLMGLFDGPAPVGAIETLRKPAISGLTSALKDLSEVEWRYALANLRNAGLLDPGNPEEPNTLDCHPLIREYFGHRLKQTKRQVWIEANSRLYDFYRSLPQEDLPSTLADLAPLYAAIPHGCAAGRQQEAWVEVYSRRIARGGEHFSTIKLGAFGGDLAVVSAFFEERWARVVDALDSRIRGFLFHQAGVGLRALGRTAESAKPMEAALELALSIADWENATAAADNLSELYLSIGMITEALGYARQCAELADRSGNRFLHMVSRKALADALHQSGDFGTSGKLFAEAEELLKQYQPECHFLYSQAGYQYCDLLLSQAECNDIIRRATYVLEGSVRTGALLDTALGHLSVGRALALNSRRDGEDDFGDAADHLNQAVDGLRQAGQQDEMPRGLLARADLYRHQGDFDRARADLEEAERICIHYGLRLLEADCHLEYARFHLAQGKRDEACERVGKARVMIDEMGYHRRDRDVAEIDAALQGK